MAAGANVYGIKGWNDWDDHILKHMLPFEIALVAGGFKANIQVKILFQREIEETRIRIEKIRLGFVSESALQICLGLQSLRLPALQTCEILQYACGPVSPLIQFHQWWKISTVVKHFRRH